MPITPVTAALTNTDWSPTGAISRPSGRPGLISASLSLMPEMIASVEIAPLTMSRENLALLQRFLSTRFPEGRSSAESYYTGFFITSMARCFEIRYRLDQQLVGVSVVDLSPSWMNAVYFFFDPDHGWRSPGTLNILTLTHICTTQKIPFLYLGYWIDGLSAMSYKSAFRPHELLQEGDWQEVIW